MMVLENNFGMFFEYFIQVCKFLNKMIEIKNNKLYKEALEFEKSKLPITSTSERVIVTNKSKQLILALNEIYKETKDPNIMDIMKRLTAIKQRAEKRLKLRI